MSHRTSIELDEALLDESRRILGTSGIRETVEAAFREIIRADRRSRLRERIRAGAGMDTGPEMLAATRPSPWSSDTSAWHRRAHNDVADALMARLDSDEVSICDQVRLEVLYSAQSAPDYDAIADELRSLNVVPCDARTFERALQVQHSLAHRGGLHHRSVTIADLLIAAAAEAAGHIVWHYNEDFDRIAAVTGQRCDWIAPRGLLWPSNRRVL